MADKQDLGKLKEFIAQNSNNRTDMVLKNTFATACYLSLNGEKRAAEKVVVSLFDWLGWSNRKTYFEKILTSFHECAAEYAWEISANIEINHLFK